MFKRTGLSIMLCFGLIILAIVFWKVVAKFSQPTHITHSRYLISISRSSDNQPDAWVEFRGVDGIMTGIYLDSNGDGMAEEYIGILSKNYTFSTRDTDGDGIHDISIQHQSRMIEKIPPSSIEAGPFIAEDLEREAKRKKVVN